MTINGNERIGATMKVRDINITNWDKADRYLGKKDYRPLAHNTSIWRRQNGNISVRYHRTDIVTFFSHHLEVTVHGYQTRSTCDRVNRLIPNRFRIYQKNHRWMVRDWENDTVFTFHEGMVIDY